MFIINETVLSDLMVHPYNETGANTVCIDILLLNVNGILLSKKKIIKQGI